jgi:hypothetical protein
MLGASVSPRVAQRNPDIANLDVFSKGARGRR